MKLVRLEPSQKHGKKLDAVFELDDGSTKVVSFGATGYEDYTMHRDAKRRDSYIARHSAQEDFEDPTAAGTLSRYILWEKPTVDEAEAAFRKRFHV